MLGNELLPVVAADDGRGWVEPGELFQHRHHILSLQRRPIRIARHRRLYLSITFRNFSRLPSTVASNWKSMVYTWCRRSAWWRRTDRPAGGSRICFLGFGVAGPPPSRAVALACGSWASLPAAVGGRPCAGPSGFASHRKVRFAAQAQSPTNDAGAWPPRCL